MITSTTAAAVSSGTRGGERMGRERVGFDEFVAARSTALLRTA
jgi:hypothetical protein